jgi:putative ABC transport system permease protein
MRPGYTAAIVLTIALTIAANAALFSIVHAVLIRQLPFKDADRLVWIWNRRKDRDKTFFSIPDLLDYQEQSRTLEDIAAFTQFGVNLTGDSDPERLIGVRLTGNALQMLGVQPFLGRILQPDDAKPGAPEVVMLTYGLWQRNFAGDRGVTRRSLQVNGVPHTIIGVLPPEFFFPNTEGELAAALKLETHERRKQRDINFLRVYARRRATATIGEVQAEMATISQRLRELYPENSTKIGPRVFDLRNEVVGSYRIALLLLWAAVTVVLLVACLNLAGLFLAQCASRKRELSLQIALGASGGRVVRQLLTESLLPSAVGGVAGTGLALFSLNQLLKLAPASLPRLAEVHVDGVVLTFSMAVALVAGLLFGLVPAAQSVILNPIQGLRNSRVGAVRGNRLHRTLIVSQVALAMTLCILACWVWRSFHRLEVVNPGINAKNVLLLRLSLLGDRYDDKGTVVAYIDKVIAEIGTEPTVSAVGAANAVPLSGSNNRLDFIIVEKPPETPEGIPGAQNRWVSQGYFSVLGIPVLAGREFTTADSEKGRGSVIIDETFARQQFRDENPLGKHIRLRPTIANWEGEIVGVVGDVKNFGLEDEPMATFYMPIPQIPQNLLSFIQGELSLVVRTKNDPMVSAQEVRHSLLKIDPLMPASAPRTMEQSFALAAGVRKFSMQIMSAFALSATALAVMGLYAVMAYYVQQNRRMFGVRIALGARPNEVLKLVILDSVLLSTMGIAIGVGIAYAVGRNVSSILFQVQPLDPNDYFYVAVPFALVLLAAGYIPARRAASVDPIVVLRYE